ncbi:MAG: hypothetical protein R3352_04940, partial [Salinisphaeraceae bacterium]|nr:hypothetical protein [Salinisphaeraceae bacterium]
VDGMENAYWQAVGGGPNTAVLVNTQGKVITKQGWYHQDNMQTFLDGYFGIPPQPEPPPRLVAKPGPRR